MKYKHGKVIVNGEEKWAVLTGSKYFTNTVTDSEAIAEERALLKSMQWYAMQMDKAWNRVVENAEKSGRVEYGSVYCYEDDGTVAKESSCQGDWLC